MRNAFLKPAQIKNADGAPVTALVRDPETLIPLAEAGEFKAMSSYWVCRVRDGDVIEVAAAEAASAPSIDA